MSQSYTKAQRLNHLQYLLTQHRDEGITQAEIADHFGVDRTTIWRDLQELQEDGVPIQELRHGHFALDPDFLQNNLSLTSAESLVLYLAGRRVARQASHAMNPILRALDKLAAGLRQPMMDALREALTQTSALPSDPDRQKVFETLTQGWLKRQIVVVWYRGLHSLTTREYHVAPCLMEPSPWGEGTYLVGISQRDGAMMTFKLERVERAKRTEQTFELPETFDRATLLNYAWGVWLGEGEPVEVVLRFSSHVIRRVRESRWHPTEQLKDLPNGELEWRAQVSEPQEMLPWIRGWGADVEVIAPDELREAIKIEVERLARLYGTSTTTPKYELPR